MLIRSLAALGLLLALSASAVAHFVFVVPESADKARVVFSDSLEPDEKIPVAKLAHTKLMARAANGKSSALAWTKGEHALTVSVPTGSKLVYGVTSLGVLQKGTAKPYLLRYYSKAIVGPIPKDGGKLGADQALEIVPVVSGDKVAFEVLAGGKLVANAEVNLIVKSGKKKLTTDARGRTEAVEVKGQCGAWVSKTEAVAGKSGGKSYEEIRTYATLVFDLAGK
jgi:uncharacterized GH25 family protein